MTQKSDFPYLHGFSPKEQDRLRRQAAFSEYTVYQDINFSHAEKVLEVGCGVGAQSEILLRRFPKMHLTGIELNDNQIKAAIENLKNIPYAQNRYELHQMDAQSMSFSGQSFDGAFICWVLEHVPPPRQSSAKCAEC